MHHDTATESLEATYRALCQHGTVERELLAAGLSAAGH